MDTTKVKNGNMIAKKYIQRVNEICTSFESRECNDKCPLKAYDCGIPRKDKDISAVIKIVEEFDEKQVTGICKQCGRDNKVLIEQDQIKYCPECGAKIESEKTV